MPGWVVLGCVVPGRVGSGRVGLGWVRKAGIGSIQIGSIQVGSLSVALGSGVTVVDFDPGGDSLVLLQKQRIGGKQATIDHDFSYDRGRLSTDALRFSFGIRCCVGRGARIRK